MNEYTANKALAAKVAEFKEPGLAAWMQLNLKRSSKPMATRKRVNK